MTVRLSSFFAAEFCRDRLQDEYTNETQRSKNRDQPDLRLIWLRRLYEGLTRNFASLRSSTEPEASWVSMSILATAASFEYAFSIP
jgi:hypothetical protein